MSGRARADSRRSALDTLLRPGDHLPLSCTRSGACCRDKAIFLNPWELARLARTKGLPSRAFRDRFTLGGIRLRMGEGPRAACSQYDPERGCSVYTGRPLACRLFPLGRQRHGETVSYLHRGEAFPCLAECPEVSNLPRASVAEFLAGQRTGPGEAAQDAYVQLTLDLSEGALALLLEGGLAAAGDRETLPRWRRLGAMSEAERAATLPADLLDRLTTPELDAADSDDPAEFIGQHLAILRAREDALPIPTAIDGLRERCCQTMAAALHLGRGAGIDPAALAERWIAVAQQNGAR